MTFATEAVVATNSSDRSWGWTLAYGVLLIVAGAFAFVHPLATGWTVGLLLSLVMIVSGAASFGAAFTDTGWGAKIVDILFGVLSIAAAVICLTVPVQGAISAAWVIGVFFLIGGGVEFVMGFKTDEERWSLVLLGMCDMLIGFWAVFLMGPGAALIAMAALVGFGLMFRGAVISAFAFAVRRAKKNAA